MKNWFDRKHFLGYVAIALVCVMLGSGLTLANGNAVAQAESTQLDTKLENVVVTSPFTAAVEAVHGSVVGVSNYRSYTNYNYGYGFGYGYGRGGRYGQEPETQEVEYSTGSGVVISDRGHVLTNYHVVEGASTVKITVGEEEYVAEILAYDANLDIAIVQAKDLKLNPVTLGDSDALRIGDWAICIGNPLSDTFTGTTTAGIVSGLSRQISTGTSTDKYGRRSEVINTMIQVDAAINSGNSGGGMFNVAGELVGIPTIKFSGSSSFFSSSASIEGIGMCIPINSAKPLIESVLNAPAASNETEATSDKKDALQISGNTGKPRMGVTIQSVSSSTFSGILPDGVFVASVEAGSPAEKGGIQAGDIIVEVNDTVIANADQVLELVGKMSVNDTLQVTVYRAEGMLEVMTAYYNREQLYLSDFPTDGEYVELSVGLAMLDEAAS